MRVAEIPSGSRGLDTSSPLTASLVAAAVGEGFAFVCRYLSLGPRQGRTDLQPAERDLILDAGLGLVVVQHVRYPGWEPSIRLGTADGSQAAVHAHALELPEPTQLWCDLEGVDSRVPASQILAHLRAWEDAVTARGYEPGLYVGACSGLTGRQLYQGVRLARYWASASRIPSPDPRGYCLRQGAQVLWHGIYIDSDLVQTDGRGGLPTMVLR